MAALPRRETFGRNTIFRTINKHSTTLLLFTATLLTTGCEKQEKPKKCAANAPKENIKPFNSDEAKKELAELQRQLREAGTPKCTERYIELVINEGSDVLNLPAGTMDPSFSTKKDAKKIAAYAVTLSGKESPHPEQIPEGNMLYNGNCGGCHGNDGKGLGGAFPDLTLPLLEGVKIRKKMFIKKIREIQERLEKEG